MKQRFFILTLCLAVLFSSCSEFATDVSDDDGYSATDINGTWKETTTGVTIRISGVTSSGSGSATLTNRGTVFPAGAVGGTIMKQVEYQSGGYWDAYNQSYTTSGTWVQGSIIGLAMRSNKREFLIGSKVYQKQ